MTDEGLRQAAAVNPGDKFDSVFRNLLETLFMERMDQNEEIFVRFMNDPEFQKIVTGWMASQVYGRFRTLMAEGTVAQGERAPGPALRIVRPRPEEKYVSCVPVVPLRAAAGAFSDPQHIEDNDWQWAAIETRHRLRPGMFVAQVVGKSMEPLIPDGAYCLFAAPVTGTRQGKTVLVQAP